MTWWGIGGALVVVDDQDALRALVADGTLAYACLESGSSFVSWTGVCECQVHGLQRGKNVCQLSAIGK